jgi:hypothetical protein
MAWDIRDRWVTVQRKLDAVPPWLRSGLTIVFSVAIGLTIVGLVLHYALRWPESGRYLGGVSRDQLKGLLDTAAGVITAVATLGLMIIALFGLQQLSIAKHDLHVRIMREAKSVAIAQCERVAKEIIPATMKYLELFAASNIPLFDFGTTPLDFKITDAVFLERVKKWVGRIPQATQEQGVAVLNALEAWAMNFTQRIADSEVAFTPTSDIFCKTVVNLYPFLILLRADNDPTLFSNVEELYRDWQGRKHASALKEQEKALAEQLERIRKQGGQGPHPKPLGS